MDKKTVTLFLIDGKTNGRYKLSLDNWKGLVYKIPRTKLADSSEIDYLSHTGIYFLVGKNELSDQPIVYIGQALRRKNGVGLYQRFTEHLRSSDKDFMTDIFAVTTTDDSLGHTEISYLENQFYHLANDSGRYKVKNNSEPTLGTITEEKKAELDKFIEQTKLLVGVLGYKMFEPVRESDSKTSSKHEVSNQSSDTDTFFINYNNLKAKGQIVTDGFVLLKDSFISPQEKPSCPDNIRVLRHSLKDKLDNYRVKEDILFSSPSQAACFVCGGSVNGREKWVTSSGEKLGMILSKDITFALSNILDEGDSEREQFTMTYKNATAYGYESESGFVVCQNSEINQDIVPSCPSAIIKLRDKHSDKINDGILMADIEFPSISTAASFVAGASQNGKIVWKDARGKTYKELYNI